MTRPGMSRRIFMAASLGASLAAGCTFTTPESEPPSPQASQAKRTQIDAGVTEALERLFRQAPDARALVQQAKGILVFPRVFKAGFIVGGEYGEGALQIAGRTVDYYSATAGSLGFQAGAQEKAVFILFLTDDSLARFRASSGWEAGADASVALVNIGAAGRVTTETALRPVVGYVLTTGGLMLDASLAGMKVSKLVV